MLHRTENHGTISLPKEFEQAIIFDIETTGLSAKYHIISMISFLYIRQGQIFIEQLMVQTEKEEVRLLTKAMEMFKKYKLYVSYNGNSFDIPFINKRAEKNELFFSVNKQRSIDLYRLLKNGKLKDVSSFDRTDTITGKQFASLMQTYFKHPLEELEEMLLLHNKDDVLSTLELLKEYPEQVRNRIFPQGTLEKLTISDSLLRLRFIEGIVIDLDVFQYGDYLFYKHPSFDTLSPSEKKECVVQYQNTIDYDNLLQILKEK